MKTRLDFSTLPIGTKVCCALFGNGEITKLQKGGDYIIGVDFGEGNKLYTIDGRYHVGFPPTLRLGHDRYKIGEPYPDFDYVEEDEIKLGDLCFVWDNETSVRLICKISFIDANGKYFDQSGFALDNMVKIPAEMLEQIKELTNMEL